MIRYVIGVTFYRVGNSSEAEADAADRDQIIEHGEKLVAPFARTYAVEPGAMLAIDHAIAKLRDTEPGPVSIDYRATVVLRGEMI